MLIEKRSLKSFNYVILITVLTLVTIGELLIYSATNSLEYSSLYHNYYLKQLVFIIVSLITMFFVSNVNYHIWIELANKLYIFTVFLLILILIIGKSKAGGFVRWFHFGSFSFQPSELCKAALVLAITRFIIDNKGKIALFEGFIKIFCLVGIPLVLIIIQPDLGTAMIFIPLIFFMMFIAGIKLKYLIYSLILIITASPFFWFLMKDYQKRRILSFINPEADPLGSGYSVIQSKIAIGSGGILGKGFLKGTQSQLNFIPEHHTDFVFSVLGEEFGFIGVLIVLCLYYVFVMEGIKIAIHAKDKAGRILATGIISMFVSQVFINIGMTLGILPVVGVPLPFLSYGGSSLLFNMVLIGILFNINSSIKKFSV